MIRKERNLIASLTALGMTPYQAMDLIVDPIVAVQSEAGLLDGIFDVSDRIEGGGVILWWNDIEGDSRSVPRLLAMSEKPSDH
jgi:UDP-glucose:glycoprotein glucosyltransferase